VDREFIKVQVESRAELRDWLHKSFEQTESIWLVTFKKGKGSYVAYDEIVEELICFGWIDSLPRKLDDTRSMLLISPRKPKSNWSKVNKDRVAKLELLGMLMPPGIAKIEDAKQTGTWDSLNEVDALIEPADLTALLKQNPLAQSYWQKFPPSARRGILEWILNAKTSETRQKRIVETVQCAEQNIRANTPRQPKGSRLGVS
jgi:uncharacterized protein YdeI (YjbR/CyaY-like superfamily)